MRLRQALAAGLTLLGLLGLPAVWAEPTPAEPEPSRLDPGAFAVRILLGVGDQEVQAWDGRVKLDKGDVVGVEGWRFREGDKVVGSDGWDAKSHTIRKAAANVKAANKKAANKKAAAKKAAAAAQPSGPGNTGPGVTANGVVVTLKAPMDATLSVETERGTFDAKLSDLADGAPQRFLENRVQAQRVPPRIALVEGPDQEDFPTAAADSKGAVWVAYVEHKARGPEVSEALREKPKSFAGFIPEGGGDRIRLVRFADGRSGDPIDVTAEGRDVWRPAVAVAGDGSVVVAWSENVDGNWDLYRRRYDPAKQVWSDPKRLTEDPGPDVGVALATAPDGSVWMAWQSWTARPAPGVSLARPQADIRLAPVEDAREPVLVTNTPNANEWSPTLAIDASGNVHVAYDGYAAGNYDVSLYTRFAKPRNGANAQTVPVANSPLFEARPTLTIDPRGRVWVAYEERGANWGKDATNLLDGKGSTLYRTSAVRVRCMQGNETYAPDPVAQAPTPLKGMNSFPRLLADRSGRIWLAFRHRQEAIWGNNTVMVVGGVWVEYITSLSGERWAPLQPLPRSDGLLDNRPALVAPSDGPILAFYNGDRRMHHEVEFSPDYSRRYYTHSGTPPGVVNNDIHVAALAPAPDAGRAVEPALSATNSSPTPNDMTVVHPNEDADVARMRSYRVEAGGKTYQLLRGEFHRHTEISQDGGNDGALEDMWRYALDAGRLDWIGNGDHDNGGGKEYTWWLIQKTTDMYHVPPSFVPMFCYERSVVYPGGHRNVMWARRGIRTLPRLIDDGGVRSDVNGRDEDAAMLYAYLNELGGICSSHTSATGMGTDWRANDPTAEPFVEIFQGHRNSYEHFGAPRVARSPEESIGGWKPLGMIWNALAMQYRLAFEASSDHISTHISYGIALAERPTREAILDAFKKRHCYAATDNILLDVRSGDHLMGDEFTADGPVRLKVFAQGTGKIAKVDIIKDFVYVYSTEPHSDRVDFTWADEETRTNPLSWYYVRVLQEDGEIAWGSPMWVHRGRTATGR